MQQLIPCNFKSYLKKLISQKFKQITIFQLQKYLGDIYTFYVTQNRTPQLMKFINQLTDEPSVHKQVMDTFLVQSERMRHFFQKSEQFFGEIVQNFEEKQVLDDKFDIFLSDNWLNDKKLQQLLTQQKGLMFDENNQFFAQLPKLMQLDQEKYRKSIQELLQKSTSYDNSTPQIQQQIMGILLQRKLKQQKVMDILSTYDVENKQKVYQTLFKSQNNKDEDQLDNIEKYDQFHPRVKPILIKYCPMAAKWKAQIVENQINLLYSQIKTLDINLIKQSLLNKRFFKKVDDIPMKMFNEIYQIQDEKLFQLRQDEKLFQQRKEKRNVQVLDKNKIVQPLLASKIVYPSLTSKIIKPKMRQQSYEQQKSHKQQENKEIYKQHLQHQKEKSIKKQKELLIKKQQNPQQQQIQQKDQPSQIQQKDEPSSIQKLKQEIKQIKLETNNKTCPQILLRQIQLNIIKQKPNQITQSINKLKQSLLKYQLDHYEVNQLFNKIEDLTVKKQDKIPKITQIRRRIQYLNLQEILFTKTQIQLNKQCEDASALVIIGETGVGKSTLLVGLSGYKLCLDPKTKDYQPIDQKIRQKYKVSKSTMSVTRWANVSKINSQWTMRRDKILLIDTPGLQENRGIEIDITNNLGTVKLIKTLKKGRIVIVISQKNFGNRWFSGFKRLIKGISKYLIDIKQLRRSITFILTKGLTLDVLMNQFNEFYRSQGYRNMNWSDNELQFIKLMREKLGKLPKQHEIHNPAKDIYQQLTNSLLELQQIQYPGQFISTSYSTQAQIAIDNAFIYTKSMINRTFQLGQYQLVKYYLTNLFLLETLQQNRKREQYKNIIERLKQRIKQNVDQFENLLKQFVMYGKGKCLQQGRKLWVKLNSQQARVMYEVVYQNQLKSNINRDNDQDQDEHHLDDSNNNMVSYPSNIIKQIVSNHKQQVDRLVQQFQLDKLLSKQIQQISLQKQTKKLFIYKLQIIKPFVSQVEYQRILCIIKQRSKQIEQRIVSMLQSKSRKQLVTLQSKRQEQQSSSQEIDQNQWLLLIKIYTNQYQVDIQMVQKNDQTQKYNRLGEIIKKKYLQNNNSNNNNNNINNKNNTNNNNTNTNTNKNKKYILQLMNQSHYTQLEGLLQKVCKTYMKNLQTLQNTHYIIKCIIQPQINELAQRLIEEINYFNQEQQKCTKQFDPKLLSLFQTYQTNKQQLYRIVSSLKNTKHYLSNTERKQQSLYKQVEKNLSLYIKNIQKDIEEMLQSPTSKKYQQIKQSTQQTFYFLKIVKSKIQQNYKTNTEMTNIKRIENDCLQKTVLNSQKIINEIQIKIKQRSERNKITNYQLNQRLLIYYFILTLFQKYQYKNISQQQKLKRKQTKSTIRQKLISPIKQVNKIDFNSHNDYQKLYKVINYFKQLDDKCIDLGFNLDDFESILPINSSQEIKAILKTSYQQIINCYRKQFVSLVQLFHAKHHSQDLNQTFLIEEYFKEEEKRGQSGIEKYQNQLNLSNKSSSQQEKNMRMNLFNMSNKSSSSQEKNMMMMNKINSSQQFQAVSQRSMNKKALEQYLNNQSIKRAINYILSYQKIRRIVQQFNEDLPSIKQQKIFQKNIDLKKQLIVIFEKISNIVEQAKNPTTKICLTRQNLYSSYRQINYLIKILSITRTKQDNVDYERTKHELNEMINKQLDNFDQLFKNTQITYKSLASGVEFDDLKRLLTHKFAKDQNNQRKIIQLLTNVQNRYSKIIRSYHPQLNKNTEVLLNMSQFNNIVQQFNNSIVQQFNNNNIQQSKIQVSYCFSAFYIKSCYRYFEQLHQKYDQYLKKLSKGVIDYQKQLSQIINQEQKILQLLPQKYKDWKQKEQNNSYRQNIIDEIYQKTKLKQKEIEQKYMNIENNQYKVSLQFRQIYSNMNAENKHKMKSVYIQKCKERIKKMQDLLHQDHLKLSNQIKTVENQLQFIPKDIEQQIHQQFTNIKNQISKVVNKRTNIVQNNLNQKNLQGVFDELDFAVKMNNIEMISSAGDALERYYRIEKKQLDLNDFDVLEKRLQQYAKVYEDKKYALIKEKVLDLVIEHERFVQKIKQEINESNKILLNKLKKQKNQLYELNKSAKFKISKFVQLKQSVADNLVKSLKIQKNFQKFFMFEQQYQNLLGNLGKELSDYKKSFQTQIQFVKVSYLQTFKKGACSKNLDPTLRTSFQQKIRSLVISKQVCLNLSKLQNRATPIDLQSSINKCVLVLVQLEQVLWLKKCQLQEWSFYQNLRNDTKERLIENFSKIIIEAQVLNKFIPIINTKNQLKQEQIEVNFYSNNQNKFKFFEKQIIYIIEQSFINPKTVSGQRVRIYYDFIAILKQNKINLFKQKIDLGTQVKNLLENKLRQTYNKIQNFAQRKQKLISYQSLLYQSNKIFQRQSLDKQTLNGQKVKQIKNIEQYYDEQLLRKSNCIVEKDLKLRSQKILQVEKKIEGDKNAMIKQIQSKYRIKQQQLAKDLSRKRIDLENKLTSFLDENLIKYLIIFQHAKTYYNCEQKISRSKLSLIDLLAKIKKAYPSSFVRDLYVRLLNNQSKFCGDILEFPIFQSYKENPFIELTKGQNFQSLMFSMLSLGKNERVMKILSQCYKILQNHYQEIIDGHRKTCSNEVYLTNKISQARNIADHIKINRKSPNKQDIVKLLAYIFALWTIIESIVDEESHQIKYHYKPHPGQILAIFLLLDLGQNAQQIPKKKIIQIQTGQGKSIVLGALSAYLALIGFDVYQACFSKYLSERDFESFSKFFYRLGIIKNIKYDIFPQICKSILDWDQNQTFREKVQKYIENSKNKKSQGFFNNFLKIFKTSQKKQIHQNKRILLIDEADVFLDQSYLGQSYRPSIRYYTKNVQKLLYFVWSKRDKILELDSQFFYKSQEFQDVTKQYDYPEFEKIMKNQVHGMMRDLAGYQNDVYTLINRKIYYKQGDGLSDKIRYGYRTLFSYFHEYEINNQINLSDLTPHIAIYFAVASFSYSLLPTYFESILGVSGTLQSMSKKQKQIIKDNFSLDILTLPSIYPKSRRTVKFRQCTNNQLYSQIVKSIEVQHAKNRPILVFFQTKQETYNFFDSQQFSKFKLYKTSIVTYEVEKQNRNFRINESTDQSNITLLTMDFSRGTDFKIKGNKKEDYQGLHVISASLPQSYSDYMQLIGRTGRQGRKGSVLIFRTSDQAIQVKQIQQGMGQKMIRQQQDKYWSTKSLQITKKMRTSSTQHQKTLQVFKEDEDTNIKKILHNIYRLNEQPLVSFHKSNTVICIDGTSSMSPVFDKVKQVINGAIPDIYKAIRASDVDAQFSIKIVIYRNYNSTHNQLLEWTNFETKEEPLLSSLKEVNFSGGWKNQAIEVCFQHINTLKNVNQIVIIADAKANTKQEMIEKRSSSHVNGQFYWNSNNFPQTFYQKELEQLIKKKIKCHSYYIGKRVKEFFDDLSMKTIGESRQFMIEEKNATQKFANFVAEKIIDDLKNVVGSDAGRKIMSNYLQISSKRNYI